MNGAYNIPEGLRQARQFLGQVIDLGLPTATELLDPITPQYIADSLCWAAIGARTVESQTHRQMASGLSMPVGFKNGTDGSAQVAVDAMISARAPHASAARAWTSRRDSPPGNRTREGVVATLRHSFVRCRLVSVRPAHSP